MVRIMASFTNEEYTVILYRYGYCDGDAAAARREYLTRREPDVAVFSGV